MRISRRLTRAVVVAVIGVSFGLAGVVGETFAQSDRMKKDDTMMKKDEMKNEMKNEDTMMKKGGEKTMKKDEMKEGKMTKDDKAMEKKQ